MLGWYLVLSPKGSIADVGSRGAGRAALADPELEQARGATPRPGAAGAWSRLP